MTKQKIQKWTLGLYIIAATFFVSDRLIKAVVLARWSKIDLDQFKVELFLNHGIIFSLPVPQQIYLPVVVTVLVIFMIAFALMVKKNPLVSGGLFFIIAGAVSNLIDRFFYDATVDYFIFFDRSAINLADVSIFVGACLLLILQTMSPKTRD